MNEDEDEISKELKKKFERPIPDISSSLSMSATPDQHCQDRGRFTQRGFKAANDVLMQACRPIFLECGRLSLQLKGFNELLSFPLKNKMNNVMGGFANKSK